MGDIIGLLNLTAIILRTAVTAQYAMWNITGGSVRRNFAMRRLLPAFSGMKNIITAVYAMRNTIRSVRRSFAMRRLLLALSGMKNIITADYAMRNAGTSVRRSFAMRRLLPAFSGMKNIITADYAMRNTPGTVRRSSACDSSLMRPSRQAMAVHPHRVIVRVRLGPARISERKLTRPKVTMHQHAGFRPPDTNRKPQYELPNT